MTTEPNRTLRPGVGRCTRRTFLFTAFLGLTACASAPGRTPGAAAERCVERQWLGGTIGDRQAAERIGRAYLDAHPQERRCERLIAEIEQALKKQDASFALTANAEQTGSVLQRLVRKEYAHGDVAFVGGWVLSRTEARLYALVAMSA